MSRVTLKDIANKAGISQQSVSKILNNRNFRAGKSTKEQVLRIAQELNYQPNFQAQTLKYQKSLLIGVSYPRGALYSENSTSSRLHYGINLEAEKTDYEIVYITHPLQVEDAIKLHQSKRMDGFIYKLYGKYLLDFIKNDLGVLQKNHVPFVVEHSCNELTMTFNNVGFSAFKAGYLMAEHLINIGYQDICYLNQKIPKNYPEWEMADGVKAAMTGNNLNLPENKILLAGRYDGVQHTIDSLKSANVLPEAIICINDYYAMNAYTKLRELGLNIPADIAIASCLSEFTRLESLKLAIPRTITTIKQAFITKGEISFRLLLDILANPDKLRNPERRTIEPQLVIRESCGFIKT